ncbi:DNA-binding SARP family transcriptional activator/predicted ATPase [Nocardiopsis mwathae]|uniref:DNA-binding SARP family transcriptional activator/predicted ATPase n=1 Tax=Nocardiopsis mwathae TaxID=1472723 RepID=A0A7W9YNB6_9ACTN|nr:BTAD domain-containing putative transcriptional regulator [Nocardiopsis mwathae]MBB6174236.1 DNA-binding SARP family transcriptional activator/predicted ATPase [Nocardiopsis mwathae]
MPFRTILWKCGSSAFSHLELHTRAACEVMKLKFRLLGNLQVVDGQKNFLLPPKLRTILAQLLISRGQTVPVEKFIEELWLDQPPATVSATMQTYIYQLRKILGAGGEAGKGYASLVTDSSGYALRTAPEDVDVHLFESRFTAGKLAFESAEYANAVESFEEAVAVWRSSALADVPRGPFLEAYAVRLEEARMQAIELRIEAYLRLGRHLDVLPELKALTLNHPLHEELHAKLMLALHRSGRRPEALDAYQHLRHGLADELGLDPSPSVQRLHRALLAGDPDLDHERAVDRIAVPAVNAPAQLPPDIAEFCGREDELAHLEQCCGRSGGDSTPRLVALSGMAGVGKTALALRLAHRLRRRYPDGQFFACFTAGRIDSCDHSVDPHEVIGSFLGGAGFTPDQIPGNLAGRSQLFRSWCADRRVLIVLDDVHSEEQVRPLLPGNPECAVIVSGRSPLYGLGGARLVEVEPMPPEDAVELMSIVAGSYWTAHERTTARRVAELCDHLPVAVRAIGSKLAVLPCLSLDGVVIRLADRRHRLNELRVGNTDLCHRLEWSYARLGTDARHTLHLLSRMVSVTFTAAEAAPVLGLPVVAAEAALTRLYDSRFLLASFDNTSGATRYRLLDLVRLFALEHGEEELEVGLAKRADFGGRVSAFTA